MKSAILIALALSSASAAPAETARSWTRAFGTPTHDAGFGLATDRKGRIYASATFIAGFNAHPLGLPQTVQPRGRTGSIVLAFDPTGDPQWVRPIDGRDGAEVRALAADGGGVVAAGYFLGALGSNANSEVQTQGGSDAFVVAHDHSGKPRYSTSYGGKGADAAVALGPLGDGVVVAGHFEHAARFGDAGDHPRVLRSAGRRDAFVMALDGAGRVLWAHAVGGAGDDRAVAVSVSGAGTIALLLMHQGGVAIGDFQLGSQGGDDGAVVRFARDGAVLDAVAFGRAGTESWDAMTVASDGAVWVAGMLIGEAEIVFGDTKRKFASAGSSDVVLARFDPGLRLEDVWRIGNETADSAQVLAPAKDGAVLLVGAGAGVLEIREQQRKAEISQGYVARIGADGAATGLVDLRAAGITQPTAVTPLPDDRFALLGMFEKSIERDEGAAQPSLGKTDLFVTVRGF